jgi:hypothetical protein
MVEIMNADSTAHRVIPMTSYKEGKIVGRGGFGEKNDLLFLSLS